MEVEVLKHDKGEVEVTVDNITVAEILRVYLNEGGSDLAVWRREHPTKPAVMLVKGKNVKKEVSDAVSAIKKDLDKIVKGVK
jgi:DNA-directed RNA polymerase subunit L